MHGTATAAGTPTRPRASEVREWLPTVVQLGGETARLHGHTRNVDLLEEGEDRRESLPPGLTRLGQLLMDLLDIATRDGVEIFRRPRIWNPPAQLQRRSTFDQ